MRDGVTVLTEGVPDRPEGRRSLTAEGVERRPAVAGHQPHRQVDEQPRPGRGHEHPGEDRDASGAEAEHQQGPEEQQRVQLRRRAETDQHAGEHRPLARPRPQRTCEQRDGQQVPVDVGGEDEARRDHRRVPGATSMGARDEPHREQRAGGEQDHVDVEERDVAGHVRGAERVGQPGRDGHEGAGEHGVLERRPVAGVDVRQRALAEAATVVERGDVGVAEPRVDVLGEVVGPARRLLQEAEDAGERREREDHAHGGPPTGARDHPGPRRPTDQLAGRRDDRVVP